ncbi:FIST signal transduction protein [Pseudomarimonas salicorniae]|uniref:FIST C-terminal domain-containing protein n=1 Tax=Pseudomarimonas salicorniae TaxID=2933270 RepID=A0ABT0GC04_9GAMM|nr:FIST N-terminal domain-containing protein [Lysobacter sp. CAU 1642]MCK7592068.1 FIST C-terminal domain-containing protein [Lysobacter sp. CAU 1642]
MRVHQFIDQLPEAPDPEVGLVLVFAPPDGFSGRAAALRRAFPSAAIAGCSDAGIIAGERVDDFGLVATAIRFDRTRARLARGEVGAQPGGSEQAGRAIAEELAGEGLRHVLVFADGLCVNGSALAAGMQARLPPGVAVTGGLAGDGPRFTRTRVYHDTDVLDRSVVAVGLYGDSLRVGFGSQGGWEPFGPERLITASRGNVLLSLDGQPALELYKRYLGELADQLPAAGLKFPLALRGSGEQRDEGIVRTILSVDERDGSMTFAGDMPEGAYARLMRADFEALIDGAEGAAGRSSLKDQEAELALLISCVGRRLVLGQIVEEEVDAVRQTLGPKPTLCGFYSYGEIAPHHGGGPCRLHNQTMTITTLSEA